MFSQLESVESVMWESAWLSTWYHSASTLCNHKLGLLLKLSTLKNILSSFFFLFFFLWTGATHFQACVQICVCDILKVFIWVKVLFWNDTSSMQRLYWHESFEKKPFLSQPSMCIDSPNHKLWIKSAFQIISKLELGTSSLQQQPFAFNFGILCSTVVSQYHTLRLLHSSTW